MPRPTLPPAVALLAVLALVFTALGAPVTAPEPSTPAAPAAPGSAGAVDPATVIPAADRTPTGRVRRRAPNIVMVMTDDMNLPDLRYMPRTRRLLGGMGSRFSQAVSTNPMCCPARAALLTGQESHNNGVLSNGGPRGGYEALVPGRRLPDWLLSAGYFTAFVGKHLNGYRPDKGDAEEPGWTVHDPILKGLYNYRTYLTWNNGNLRRHRGYVTNYVTDKAKRIVKAFDRRRDARPFFLWAADVAPHNAKLARCNCFGDPIPAKRDRGSMQGKRSLSRQSPAYNHRNRADKPPFMRRLGQIDKREVDRTFQRRVESLKSVDRQVRSLVRLLRRKGELKRTVFIFTSDNGYMLGEHRFVGKRLPYEDSVRIPLLVRGPGMARGVVTDRPVSTVDLTATIVDLAGAQATHALDGTSLVPGLRNPDAAWSRYAQVTQTGAAADKEGDTASPGETVDLKGWLHRGYRDPAYSYSHWPAAGAWPAYEELYDRRRDPAQLRNLVDDPAYAEVLAEVRRRAAQLAGCAGDGCYPAWGPLPKPS